MIDLRSGRHLVSPSKDMQQVNKPRSFTVLTRKAIKMEVSMEPGERRH